MLKICAILLVSAFIVTAYLFGFQYLPRFYKLCVGVQLGVWATCGLALVLYVFW